MSTEAGKDAWDKARSIATIVSAVLIPLMVALVGNWYTSAISARELNLRYVELALGILSSEPTPEQEPIREWAVEIVNLHSPVTISEEARREILDRPFGIEMGGDAASLSRVTPEMLERALEQLEPGAAAGHDGERDTVEPSPIRNVR